MQISSKQLITIFLCGLEYRHLSIGLEAVFSVLILIFLKLNVLVLALKLRISVLVLPWRAQLSLRNKLKLTSKLQFVIS